MPKNLSLFIFVAIYSLVLSGQTVSAAVLQVDDTCSLHDAIKSANTDAASGGCPAGAGADTITLTGDVTLSEELPIIESVISIEGDGYAISGGHQFRIFAVNNGRLTIDNLTLKEGRPVGKQDGRGGAIYTAAWNVQLDIRGSRFLENKS